MAHPPNPPTPPAPPTPAPDAPPPWLHVARAELGVREYPGARANPRIVEYFGATTLATHPLGKSDETAWCSAFMCWVFGRAGFTHPRSARARDWLKWGVELPSPRLGCVAVLWRGTPRGAQGHVALYVPRAVGVAPGGEIDLLGGNQRPTAGQVSVTPYPTARVLGYRWPTGWPVG